MSANAKKKKTRALDPHFAAKIDREPAQKVLKMVAFCMKNLVHFEVHFEAKIGRERVQTAFRKELKI